MLIDSHAHVNFNAYQEDGDEVIKKCLDNDVWVVNVGSEFKTSQRAVEYANRYNEGVYAIVGLHPIHVLVKDRDEGADVNNEDIKYREEFNYQKYFELAKDKKVVAIGEVGLDYHHFDEGLTESEKEKIIEKQKEIFIEFIKIANEVGKPVAIHCWGAYKDLIEIFRANPVDKKGIIHSFTGSYKTAREFRELGFKLSFNGIITYSESYDKVIKDTPIEDILIETDCPYLNPSPLDRYGRNEPMNVGYVLEKISELKEMDISEVEKIVEKNTRGVLGI
ncbi:MAG: TatD family hydrolase [Candidatus Moraniibacteriota bacterium]